MSALALDYTYRYAFSSELAATAGGGRLRLATTGGSAEHPYFFQGRLTTVTRPIWPPPHRHLFMIS